MSAQSVATKIIGFALQLPSDKAQELFDILDEVAQLDPSETEMLRSSEFQYNIAQQFRVEH